MENVLRMAEHNNNINGFITKAPRILVADDEATIRKIIKLVLEQSQYEVVEASSGAEALTIISKNTFDLILLDIIMPDINGLEVLKYMREGFSDFELPIILVTGKDKSEDCTRGLKLGASDYIAKPINEKVLLARIEKQLSRKQAFDRLKSTNKYLQQNAEVEKEELHKLRDHNEMILNCAGEGIYGINAEGRLTFLNPAAAYMIGWERHELIGESPHAFLHHSYPDGSPYPENECPIYKALNDGMIHRINNEVFWRKDGTCFPVEYVTTPIRDNYGELCGAVVVYRDITDRKQAEENLQENELRMSEAQKIAHVGNWECDANDNFGWWSEEMFRIFGVDQNKFKPTYSSFLRSILPEDRKDLKIKIDNTKGTDRYFDHICRVRQPNGKIRYVEIVGQLKSKMNDHALFLKGVCQDITDRKKAEESLRTSEQKYRVLYEDNPSMYFSIGRDRKICSVNRTGSEQLGYTAEELVGRNILDLIYIDDRTSAQNYLDMCFANPETMHKQEIRMSKKDEEIIWIRETSRVIKDTKNNDYLLTVAHDITETHRMSEQLSHQASHDYLTDLVNRKGFEHHLHWAFNTPQVDEAEHVLCYLDFDNFKVINDTCGHSAGDILLLQLGQVLRENIRKRDILARLGGNEFAIFMEHCSIKHACQLARKLLDKVKDFRFVWENNVFIVGVSIGLASTSTTRDKTDLLKKADTACYAAKEKGGNRIHIYSEDDIAILSREKEVTWVTKINQALEAEGFMLYAQPIKPLGTAQTNEEHYELLIRMVDPENNITPPSAFLPAAENFKLASKLDRWVINTALDLLTLDKEKLRNLELCSINLSGLSLSEQEFLDFVIYRLMDSTVPPQKICFEITETAVISDMPSASKFINTLKELGCKFALDDFGSGLSSFGYLKQLPVDFLKIDGMFIKNIAQDSTDFAMVKMINEIGQVMGMKTIAEFVENDSITQKLEEIGVNYAQGYGIGHPQPFSSNPN
jgi:diguanylate cyclase (GGDEF)-like protein/PAS domain S-box-containing protein